MIGPPRAHLLRLPHRRRHVRIEARFSSWPEAGTSSYWSHSSRAPNRSRVTFVQSLFHVAAIASWLLLVASCVFWARSYRLTERVSWSTAGGWRTVVTGPGQFTVQVTLSDWSSHAAKFHGP